MTDIYELFSKFELELLPKGWVDSLSKDDFSEAIDFPVEYDEFLENTDIGQLMSVASKFIKDWLESGNLDVSIASTSTANLNTSQISSKSWQDLKSNNVQHKALISMLSIFILRGKTEQQFEHKRLGLIATDLYFMLLAIPGSEVFHIFNPILYSCAMENLKICSIFDSSGSSAKTKSKPPKKRRGRQEDDDSEEEAEMDNEEENEDLSNSEKSIVLELLITILNNLKFSLQKFKLKDQNDSLLITIQILILLTRVEKNTSLLFNRSPSGKTLSHLATKAYQTLFKLYNPNHGEISETARLTVKEMMPAFLIFSADGLKLPPKEALVIKDHSLQFVRNLLLTVKDQAYTGVLILIQFIMSKIPDKADLRAKGVQVILELLGVLPDTLYSRAVVWTLTFSLNDQVKYRVTALEIITKLLHEPERAPTLPEIPPQNGHESEESEDEAVDNEGVDKEPVDNEGVDKEPVDEEAVEKEPVVKKRPIVSESCYSTHKYLLAAIFARCLDNASSVRSKALAILANLFTSNNRSIKKELESIFTTPYMNGEVNTASEKGFCNFVQLMKSRKTARDAPPNPLPGARAVIQMIEIFIMDDKVFVRKAALLVLSNIFILNEKWMTNKLLQVMVDNIRDVSVMVRKLMVQCLTDLLLHYPSHPELPKFWVKGVMPLLMEDEVKAQEKVLEMLYSVVIDNLVAYNQMKTPHHSLTWTLLDLIVLRTQKLFSKACEQWAINNTIKQSLINTIKTHIGTENNSTAWYLLASLSEYLNIKDPQFVLEYFYDNVLHTQQVDEYCCQLVTEVMYMSCRQLPKISQVQLCETLLKHLAQFTIPLPMISRCVDICQMVTETQADSPEKGREDTKVWGTVLIQTCENRLEKVIGPNSPTMIEDDNRLCQYVFTLGEACQICPGVMKKSVLDLIKNMLCNRDDYSGNSSQSEDEETPEHRWEGQVSAAAQGFAVVTLGKLCLQKSDTAKSLVPLLGHLLSYSPHPEIKINAMIGLTDMCIKYTSMVEYYLPDMCLCLKDKHLAVRENTLKLLIQLIQEDYLKLRCPMFFHILSMLLDEEMSIRDMTSSFIINSLLKKKKDALVQHFVEALLHYNAYLEHKTFARMGKMTARERALFSLEGPEKQEQRRSIFRFMVENMMDDQRFKITHRLCTEILSEVAEGNIKLSNSGTTLLQDALYVLSCDEIRLSQWKRSGKEDDDNDVEEEAHINHALNNMARKTLINALTKKNLIDNVVPIFIKLKHTLQQMKSPLVRDLMACLRELMKDYKQEIDEILADDKELAIEISHDLKALADEECEEERKSEASVNEVLKQVMELSVARKSLNGSKLQSPRGKRSNRLSTSSAVTMNGERSPLSPKSQNVPSVPQSPASNFSSPSNRQSPGSNKSSPGTSGLTQQPSAVPNGRLSRKQSSASTSSSKSDFCAPEAMEEDNASTASVRSRKKRGSTSSNKSVKQPSPTLLTKSELSVSLSVEDDIASTVKMRQRRSSTNSNQSVLTKQPSPSTSSTKPEVSIPKSMEEDSAPSSSSVRPRHNRVSTSSSTSEASTSHKNTNSRRTKRKK